MKKVVAICLLMIFLLGGGMSLDAKTTKKKSNSKARTIQTSSSKELPKFDDFFVWGYNSELEKDMYIIRNDISSKLKKYGYIKKWDKFINHVGDFTSYNRYGGPEIWVSDASGCFSWDVIIKFKSKSECLKYWDYLKGIGFSAKSGISDWIYKGECMAVLQIYPKDNMYEINLRGAEE